MAATNYEQQTFEAIRNMSDVDLADFRKDKGPPLSNFSAILADRELERRDRLHQHELNRKLIAEQVRWMKFSAFAGVAAALAGVILGWYLQRNWPLTQSQNTAPPAQSQTSSSTTAVDRKEKAESVPSKPPESGRE